MAAGALYPDSSVTVQFAFLTRARVLRSSIRSRPASLSVAVEKRNSGRKKTPHIAAGRFASDFHCLKRPCIDVPAILQVVKQ
jgi:hypothetical protein